jgi:ArsR family transcriptional regulator
MDSGAVEDVRTVEQLKALGDPVRWAIVSQLHVSPVSARRLADAVRVSPTLLSHHLKVLREAGLIVGTRRGRWIDYSLEPKALRTLGELLQCVGTEAISAAPAAPDLLP